MNTAAPIPNDQLGMVQAVYTMLSSYQLLIDQSKTLIQQTVTSKDITSFKSAVTKIKSLNDIVNATYQLANSAANAVF